MTGVPRVMKLKEKAVKEEEGRGGERMERWARVLLVAQPVKWCHLYFETMSLKLREVK